jgi:Amt family ammonium transporter
VAAGGVDPAATAWVLVSTAMVFFMSLGLGFFYGGLVRRKNVVSMIMLSFVSMALVSIQWYLIGYSLAFGHNVAGGLVGGFDYLWLRGLGGTTISSLPGYAFAAFQMAFAGIALGILTSGFAERTRLAGFLVFGLLWTTLVYDPVAHWVWGGGWLHRATLRVLGAAPLDFAGGTVVHITSGFSALVVALLIGRRLGFGEYSMKAHNIPLALIGAAILWFGWFGFNAGSALTANASAALALLNTHLAAAAGALAWMLAAWARVGRPGSLGFASGAVAGLVAVTPAAGYVAPWASIVIGALAGLFCYAALEYRVRHGIDESLDAWAVHGVGGLWGSIATGIFADPTAGGARGLIYGGVAQFAAQLVDAAVAVAYSMLATYMIYKLVDKMIGIRVGEEEEYVGLDLAQHGEEAYSWGT